MPWVESVSPSFRARHGSAHHDDVTRVLHSLELSRERLSEHFPVPADEITLVLHGSTMSLWMASPLATVAWIATAPAARRYVAGWAGRHELHVLAPALLEGAARWFSGQVEYSRPAVARRLREGSQPSFPPGLRDAPLLGGTVVDLLAHEEGSDAAARFARTLHPHGPRAALSRAFRGRPLVHTEGAWRTHLARIASA